MGSSVKPAEIAAPPAAVDPMEELIRKRRVAALIAQSKNKGRSEFFKGLSSANAPKPTTPTVSPAMAAGLKSTLGK